MSNAINWYVRVQESDGSTSRSAMSNVEVGTDVGSTIWQTYDETNIDAYPNLLAVGLSFTTSETLTVSGLRFWCTAATGDTVELRLYEDDDTLIASVDVTANVAGGWVEGVISPTVDILAGTYGVTANADGTDDCIGRILEADTPAPTFKTGTSAHNGQFGDGVSYPANDWTYYGMADVILEETLTNQLGAFTRTNAQSLEWVTLANGNSETLDAVVFPVSGGSLDVQPLDVVTIFTEPSASEGGRNFIARWRGFVTSITNPNSTDGEALRFSADGLYKALERVTTPNKEYSVSTRASDQELEAFTATDLAEVAWDVFVDASLPFGITIPVTYDSAAYDVGVDTAAIINPGGGNLKQFTDAIVNLALEGAVDAAAVIDVEGELTMALKRTQTISVNETIDAAVVEWLDVDATNVVNAVKWLIADGTSSWQIDDSAYSTSLRTPDALTHTSTNTNSLLSDNFTLEAVPEVQQDSFRQLTASATISTGSLSASYVYTTADSPSDLGRVEDSNSASYAEIDSSSASVVLAVDLSELDNLEDLAAISYNVRPDAEGRYTGGVLVDGMGRFASIAYGLKVSGLLSGETTADEREEFVVFGDRARNVGAAASSALDALLDVSELDAVDFTLAVEDFRAYRIDTTKLDAAAEDYFVEPTINQVRVRLFRQDVNPTELDLTYSGGTVADLEIEYARSRITTEGGYELEFVAGNDTPVAAQAVGNKTRGTAQTQGVRAARARGRR